MTTLEHTSPLRSAPRLRWANRAVNAVALMYRSWKNRRQFLQLGEMSDAQLADLGLVRGDLHSAVGLPFGIDPTVHLNAVVRQRVESREDAARRVC